MVDFIKKLKSGMYMREMMNVVLEHLGVIQVNDFKLNFINIGYFLFFSFRQLYLKIQMNYFYVLHIFLKLANHHH
jgi:hypothetical protein